MTFEVIIRKEVEKKFRELPKAHYAKIKRFLDILKFEAVPYHSFDIEHLKGTANIFAYRVRIGKYRLTYVVEWSTGIITVLRLDVRGKMYK